MDERVIIDPDTGERFLIPVSDEPSASAVGLLEPWACVERAYATEERGTLKAGGEAARGGRDRPRHRGPAPSSSSSAPPGVDHRGRGRQRPSGRPGVGRRRLRRFASRASSAGSFDDIIYFGADPERVETLQALLSAQGRHRHRARRRAAGPAGRGRRRPRPLRPHPLGGHDRHLRGRGLRLGPGHAASCARARRSASSVPPDPWASCTSSAP